MSLKNDNYFNGFILGFFIGGIIGIAILNLINKNII
jgi:hypothetical protein